MPLHILSQLGQQTYVRESPDGRRNVCMKDLGYVNRLKALKLLSLHYRRAIGDILEKHKYSHGIYQVQPFPLKLDTNPQS